jgi:hypothetical protein
MDGSGPKFFSLIHSVLSVALAASLLASAGPRALAETGAIMIAIGQMKLGSAPTGFTFARTGKGGDDSKKSHPAIGSNIDADNLERDA